MPERRRKFSPEYRDEAVKLAIEAGTYRISQLHGIEPGGTRSGYWNNTPQGRSYFVDVRPISTTVTKPAVIELVRSWRKLNWNANNTTELERRRLGPPSRGLSWAFG
jgi:transposase-like protein